jgi:DNA modification methylase
MINFYKQNNGTYKVIPKKFEDTEYNDFDGKTFDLMLTSPPYFLAEEYSKDILYNNNVDTWLNKFMFPSLIKVWKLLKIKGRILLILDDIFYENHMVYYVDRIIKYIKTFDGAIYEGMQKYSHMITRKNKSINIIQPIWTFYKE